MKRTEEEDEEEARKEERRRKKKVFRVLKKQCTFFSHQLNSSVSELDPLSFLSSLRPRRHDERGGPRTSLSEEDDYSDDDDASEEDKYY